MKLDPVLNAALAMHSGGGAYALLLGSGISTAAGVPTGWQVVLDLVQRLARAQGQEPGDDTVAWHTTKYGEAPEYSKLLDELTHTQAERAAMLRSYFEPTEEEREKGLKVPTAAHKAVARLAKLGCVRLILTTNFDRLIEQALDAEGIQGDVIASVDMLKGAVPLVHSRCMVVKLHGDYRDTRIRNTPAELAAYPEEVDAFLDRAFDEFGLIVCGWSGTWDTALRDAILRCPNRRYTTFWLAKGELTKEGQEVVRHRKAELIPIESADSFFVKLLEHVETLQDLNRPHPLATAALVETVKRYVPEPHHRVRLHDLIHEETEAVYTALVSDRFFANAHQATNEGIQQRMREYEAASERLVRAAAALSYHDNGDNAALLTRSMERLLEMPMTSGIVAWVDLQYYPALLLLYAAGMAALAGQRFANYAAVTAAPAYHDSSRGKIQPGLKKANLRSVLGGIRGALPLENAERRYTPASEHMCTAMRPWLRQYLPSDRKYDDTFDLFEFVLALTYSDILDEPVGPVGRFAWRWGSNWEDSPMAEFVRTGLKRGAEWPAFKSGLFRGSPDRFKEVADTYLQTLKRVTSEWMM